jgi:hypothetical protein
MSITFTIPSDKTSTVKYDCCDGGCPYCDGLGYIEVQECPHDVNMSNRNAFIVMEYLGIPLDYCGAIPVSQLPSMIRKCVKAIHSHEADDLVAGSSEGIVFSGAFSRDAFNDRLNRLMILFRRAIDVNDDVSYG